MNYVDLVRRPPKVTVKVIDDQCSLVEMLVAHLIIAHHGGGRRREP